jgi:RNA 3'-terminal phosphate cyclase (ATP)
MRTVDGTAGGGQILRTSLALSMHTGEPFRIEHIRASRPKPGLQRQHLASVQAAQSVSNGCVDGAHLGSTELTFRPGEVFGGAHAFHIGSAGSTGLVLQTVLLALATGPEPSVVELRGGTHNAWAPPFDFLAKTFLPLLGKMGATCTATLQRHGFYPAGGGRVAFEISPVENLTRIDLLERGDVHDVTARVLVAGIGGDVLDRERRAILRESGWPQSRVRSERLPDEHGPGNAVLIEIESDALTTVLTTFGRRGLRAEHVASRAVQAAQRYLDAVVPVDSHLADQLLLPMAFAGGGRFRTLWPVDDHTTSNAQLISDWLGASIAIERETDAAACVTVGRRRGPGV